jgi:putative ABC transport system substrate-binding protein
MRVTRTRLDAALRGIERRAGNAFIVTSDTLFLVNKDAIAAAIRRAKLPAVAPDKEYQGDGILMSYGPSLNWMARRAAAYVDKTAQTLGLTIPESVLLRADEVIR